MNDQVKNKLWNFIFSIIFLIITFTVGVMLINKGVQINLEIFEFVLLILATFRLIRLFVYDKVMLWFRDIFKIEEPTGCFNTISSLLGCPWCFGAWGALIIVSIYYLVPFGELFIVILAIAGVGALIQLCANLIGWSAEKKKKEVQKMN